MSNPHQWKMTAAMMTVMIAVMVKGCARAAAIPIERHDGGPTPRGPEDRSRTPVLSFGAGSMAIARQLVVVRAEQPELGRSLAGVG